MALSRHEQEVPYHTLSPVSKLLYCIPFAIVDDHLNFQEESVDLFFKIKKFQEECQVSQSVESVSQ